MVPQGLEGSFGLPLNQPQTVGGCNQGDRRVQTGKAAFTLKHWGEGRCIFMSVVLLTKEDIWCFSLKVIGSVLTVQRDHRMEAPANRGLFVLFLSTPGFRARNRDSANGGAKYYFITII